MEKLAGDLLFGLKLVKLSILPTLFIQFVYSSLGELRSRYLGFKGLNIKQDVESYLPIIKTMHNYSTLYTVVVSKECLLNLTATLCLMIPSKLL